MTLLRVEERPAPRPGIGCNPRLAWLIVFMLSVFMLINFADKVVFGLSALPIMRELGLTHTQFGLIGTSFYLFFSATAVGVGFLVNRVSTKRVLAAMAMMWSLCQLLMFIAVGLPALVANRLVLGLGEGPAYPVALHAAYKWVPDPGRPLATSLIAIGAAVGAGIAAPAILYVIVAYSWHVAFGALGILGVVWFAVWVTVGREGALAPGVHIGPPGGPAADQPRGRTEKAHDARVMGRKDGRRPPPQPARPAGMARPSRCEITAPGKAVAGRPGHYAGRRRIPGRRPIAGRPADFP